MDNYRLDYGFVKEGKPFGLYRWIRGNGNYTDRQGDGYLNECGGNIKVRFNNVVYTGECQGMIAQGKGSVIWRNFKIKWSGQFE